MNGILESKNDKNEGITYLGRFMDKILRVQNRRVKTGAAHALAVTWRCRNLCVRMQERLRRHVIKSTSGRNFLGIYKVSYQIHIRFTSSLYAHEKSLKVSSKYHKCDRSIMKLAQQYHQISIKASRNPHKASCIIAKPPTRKKGPKNVRHFGHLMPAVRAMSARNLVCRCPSLGP